MQDKKGIRNFKFVFIYRYSADLTNLQEYDLMSQGGVGVHPKGNVDF